MEVGVGGGGGGVGWAGEMVVSCRIREVACGDKA